MPFRHRTAGGGRIRNPDGSRQKDDDCCCDETAPPDPVDCCACTGVSSNAVGQMLVSITGSSFAEAFENSPNICESQLFRPPNSGDHICLGCSSVSADGDYLLPFFRGCLPSVPNCVWSAVFATTASDCNYSTMNVTVQISETFGALTHIQAFVGFGGVLSPLGNPCAFAFGISAVTDITGFNCLNFDVTTNIIGEEQRGTTCSGLSTGTLRVRNV